MHACPDRLPASECLHLQATEDFIVHLLEDCNLCAIHAKRVTISKTLGSVSRYCNSTQNDCASQ